MASQNMSRITFQVTGGQLHLNIPQCPPHIYFTSATPLFLVQRVQTLKTLNCFLEPTSSRFDSSRWSAQKNQVYPLLSPGVKEELTTYLERKCKFLFCMDDRV